MSRPCDYGMCSRNCTEWNTCTEPLPQLRPEHVAPLPSLLLPHKERKEIRRWCHEDVIFIQFSDGAISVVSSDSPSGRIEEE